MCLKTEWVNRVKRCETYVMCSTLNQIVNYLPFQYIKRKQSEDKNKKISRIYSLTYEDGAKNTWFQNKNWNTNFNNVLYNKNEDNKGIGFEEIELKRKFNLQEYINEINLKLNASEHVIWNLTGGQRSVIFSVKTYIENRYREMEGESSAHQIENTILYLEGNTQKMIVGIYDKKDGWQYEQLDESYGDKDLNLEKAFHLMGYCLKNKVNTIDYTNDNITDKPVNDKTDNQFLEMIENCMDFYETKYNLTNPPIRKNLILSNRQKDKNEGENDFKKVFKDCGFCEDKTEKILDQIKKNNMRFGYFLEYIAFGIIDKEIKEKFNDGNWIKSLSHNVKISHNSMGGSVNSSDGDFCELDIVLLTQTGQIVVFECKSGTMESENAKAREYTTYALGGAYGKPVLITPLNQNEIKDIEKLRASDIAYEYICQAFRAAGRANLEIYGLDEIGKKITQLFCEIKS